MDRHVKEKMHQVFQGLTRSTVYVGDDTCLNKLADILTETLDNIADVEDCGIPEFFQIICHTEIGIPTLVFGIRVAGILGIKMVLRKQYHQLVIKMLQKTLSHDFLEEPSVGEAFYTVLKEIPSSISLSLENLMDVTFKTLQRRCSFFLRRAIIQFVISHYSKCSDDLKELVTFLNRICEHIENVSSTEKIDEKYDFMVACFEIIKHLIEIQDWRTQIYQKIPYFDELLLKKIECGEKPVYEYCLQCLISLMGKDRVTSIHLLKARVLDVINRLMKNQIMKGQDVCYRLVHSGLIPEHLEWMKSVITSPFKLLVSTESKHDYDIQGQVTSRTEAIKLYCFTLEKLDQLGLQNALDPEIKEMVVKIFELTINEECGAGMETFLHGSQKVQQKCLQILNKGTSNWELYVSRIIAVLSTICMKSNVDIVTYSKCLDCAAAILPYALNSSHSEPIHLDTFVYSIQRHLCDISWDGREATLSFLKFVFCCYKADGVVMKWICDHRLNVAVWLGLSDSESYVRSTAISCLGNILQCQILRDHLMTELDTLSLDIVISQIENLGKTDTEAFVRRSVVDCFTLLWGDNSVLEEQHKQSVLQLMSCDMVKDFDWEVKLKVVQFWKHVIQYDLRLFIEVKPFPSYSVHDFQTTNQETLVHKLFWFSKSGCLEALFVLTDDFDNSVVEKTLELIREIKEFFVNHNLIDFIQDSLENDHIMGCCNITKKPKLDHELFESIRNGEITVLIDLLTKLMSFNVENKLSQVSERCDEHDPISLLDDILSYVGSHDTLNNEDKTNVIDCY